MQEAINKRISRRTFEKKAIPNQIVKQIEIWIGNINDQSGLAIQFIEDGSAAFQSFKKTYGMFKNVRSVILLKGMKDDIHLKEKIGYYGEELILHMTNLDLGTCWVGGTFDENVFKIETENEELICVIPVGIISSTTLKEKMIRSAVHRKTKTMEERITSDSDLPQWVVSGMEVVMKAPSALNSQKTKFIFKDHQIYAEIINDYKLDMVDLGIAKKHFEIGAGGTFEFGNGGRFNRS
nr:nitroreductase family protein [uncultured Niameybacter sp.]